MPIIVDKQEKRRNIALSCTELLLDKGFSKLRISEIAATAGVGKGTIYGYFKNKEDVIFEIIRNMIVEHQQELYVLFKEDTSCKLKVLQLFDFFLCEKRNYEKHLEMYKEYLSVALTSGLRDMHEFNRECSEFIRNILEDVIIDGIKKGEIMPESINLVDGIMSTERGFMVKSWSENRNCRNDFKQYIETLFELIEM